MLNFYDRMKSKQQKNFNEMVHWFNLLNVLLAMFEWDGLPDTIHPEQLEGILISNGTVGIGKINGDLWCGYGGYCGDVKGYLPSEYKIAVSGVGDLQGRWDSDIVVGWNNATMTPDMILMQYANILAEIDVSEKLNVIFTRDLKIPKVRDQKEKVAIENAIKDIRNGNVSAVISSNIHDARDLIDEGLSSEDNFLQLTDVKDVDKLQYLNQYRDNIIKRFFQIYGISSQVTNKMAQQSTDEVHSNDDVAMTLFLQRYKYRQQLADDLNTRFGLNVSVKLAESWKDSYDEIILEQSGDETDEPETETESD